MMSVQFFTMSRLKALCIGTVVLHLVFLLIPLMLHAETTKKTVLVLHSYHSGLSWTDAISEGIRKRFAEESFEVVLVYEYMDTKRFSSKEYYRNIEKTYQFKYSQKKVDAVISSDDDAFQFLLRVGEKVFKETPLIFCGVNDFKSEHLENRKNITGVLEKFDFAATLDVALSLRDGIKKVVVIGDQTSGGRANHEKLVAKISQVKKKVTYEFLNNHTMEEILARVGELQDDTIVFWLYFQKDRNGERFKFKTSAQRISQASRVPLFSFWDVQMGGGIVGGMITSGNQQGYSAAELAVKILKGGTPSANPVVSKSLNRYMFDYVELKRFDIKLSRLPADSIVINLPQSFFSRYKKIIVPALMIFFVLSVIIFLLIANNYKGKRAERMLMDARDRYLGIFNDTSVALLVEDFSALVEIFKRVEKEALGNFKAYFASHQSLLEEMSGKIKIKDINPAAIKLYRAESKTELIGGLDRIQFEARRSEFTGFLIAILEKRKDFTVETVNRTLTGEKIDVILKVRIPADYDDFGNIQVSVVDITERKKAERALLDSENRFRTAFNSAASGMALLSIEGRYLKVNRVLCTILGYTEEELLGKNWADITHPEDIDVCKKRIDRLKKQIDDDPFEKRYISKNGEIIWVLFSGSMIFDRKGQPAYFISQFQNITQRKEAQSKLLEQKERYRKYFEDDLSGVFVIDYKGNFVTCNQVFCEMFGIAGTAPVEKLNYFDFFQKKEDSQKFFNMLVLKKKLAHIELQLKRVDGTFLDVVINAIGRFSGSGKLKEIQGYIMDVTHQKTLETQLLQVQKLESIGTMAGGVAHDFNNLLMGVLGNTSLLLLDKNPGHPDYKRLKNIEDYVKSGSSLTRQLLGFAKGGKYEVKTCDINEILAHNSDMFGRTRKEILIKLELNANKRAVDIDKSQIDQVMYNLYVNAWQAMPEGGRILIKTANVELDETYVVAYNVAGGSYLKIEVIDDGEGMDHQTLKRIFDPFFTTKEIGRGIGLGLASSYGIIQNHAGIIEAESTPGQGAKFSIYLPVSLNSLIEEEPAPNEGGIIKGKERVLLIDDEDMIIEVGVQMLKALGYEVEHCLSGRDAIEKYKENHGEIDLVILDMIMPGMSGGETFDALREIDDKVKVILSSGYSFDQKANAILQRGCLGFLQKPFDLQTLSEKVRHVLEPQTKETVAE